jgi:hypothetical protein
MTSPSRIYRFAIWLPLLVPFAVVVMMNVLFKGLGMSKSSGYIDYGLETLAWSGIFGGLPYAALAVWATWWIRDRPEPEIRRLMFLAPLLMVGAFAVGCLLMGVVAWQLDMWIRIAVRGAGIIIPLGYAYVALRLLLRHWLGPRAIQATP